MHRISAAPAPGCGFRLACTAGLTLDKIALERLPFFLRGSEGLPMALFEQLLANAVGVVVRPVGSPSPWQTRIAPRDIRRVGFRDEEAMLPYGHRSFSGYRLLHEYFAIPERFLFVELTGLGPSIRRCQGAELEIFVLFDRLNRALEHRVDASMVGLFCTPAVNLFPLRADRIHLDNRRPEFQVIPDRTRPMDYEVYEVTEVIGYGDRDPQGLAFLPFYASFERAASSSRAEVNLEHPAYYTGHRTHRVLSEKQQRSGPRASYIGTDLYLSLVDPEERLIAATCGNWRWPHSARIAIFRC